MISTSMFDASARILKFLAALVWYSGFVVLFYKSATLFIEADKINPNQQFTWLAVLGGLVLGGIKAKYLFRKLCLRNLKRIEAIKHPKIWHFYRIAFFVFLLSMIVLGLFLSKWVQGNYTMLITLAIIELSIATALLTSCDCFWIKN